MERRGKVSLGGQGKKVGWAGGGRISEHSGDSQADRLLELVRGSGTLSEVKKPAQLEEGRGAGAGQWQRE